MIGRSVILYEKMTRDTPLMLFNAFGGQTILQIVIGLVIPAKPRLAGSRGAHACAWTNTSANFNVCPNLAMVWLAHSSIDFIKIMLEKYFGNLNCVKFNFFLQYTYQSQPSLIVIMSLLLCTNH